jgi:hypothetical protein
VWSCSATTALFAVILSIFFIVAISQTSGNIETEHFIATLDKCTFGVGSFSPLLFLYVSIVSAAAGWWLWIYLTYDGFSNPGTSLAWLTMFITANIFIFFSMEIVASLHHARQTEKSIRLNSDPVRLTPEEIKVYFLAYTSSFKPGETDFEGSEDGFILFIRCNLEELMQTGGGLVPKRFKSTVLCRRLGRFTPSLGMTTESSARAIYSKWCKARCSSSADPFGRSVPAPATNRGAVYSVESPTSVNAIRDSKHVSIRLTT